MRIYPSGFPILSVLTYLPLLGAIMLLFFNKENARGIKTFATVVAGLDFVLSVPLWWQFDTSAKSPLFQFRESVEWIPSLGVRYSFGIDGIALLLLLLTTLMGFIAA